jgi:hypothetical protein
MNRQQEVLSSETSGGLAGLAGSLMKMMSASTVFSLQQVQNTLHLFTDSRKAISEFQHTLDAISGAMIGEVNPTNQSVADKMNRTGARIINATSDAAGGAVHVATHWQPEEMTSGRKA